jgi:hypothetical protein
MRIRSAAVADVARKRPARSAAQSGKSPRARCEISRKLRINRSCGDGLTPPNIAFLLVVCANLNSPCANAQDAKSARVAQHTCFTDLGFGIFSLSRYWFFLWAEVAGAGGE